MSAPASLRKERLRLSERFRSDGDVSMKLLDAVGYEDERPDKRLNDAGSAFESLTDGLSSNRALEISSHQRPTSPPTQVVQRSSTNPPEPTTGLSHQLCKGLQSTEASCIGHVQGGRVQLEFATSVEDLVLDHRDQAACRSSFERP